MEVFVARQPILDIKGNIFAFEILYRNSNHLNSFPDINGDRATTDVLINSFLNIGLHDLTNGKPSFINFTENLLKLRLPTFFNPEEIVVEILETFEPGPELVEICKELKELGFRIALDDYMLKEKNPHSKELIKLVNFIKVDFLSTTPKDRQVIVNVAKENGVLLIAEKVETKNQYEEAKNHAFDYFQGFYFSEPEIISEHDIPNYTHSYTELMQKFQPSETNIDELLEIIEKDLSLSYKILKLINTSPCCPKQKVHSIRQALVLLGFVELKKWIYIHALKESIGGKSCSLEKNISSSLTRGKLCESIAGLMKQEPAPSTLYMTGTISRLDSLLNIPLEEILDKLPLHEDISEALQGKQNLYKEILDLSIALETAQWSQIGERSKALELDVKDLFKLYAEANSWSNNLLNPEEERLI